MCGLLLGCEDIFDVFCLLKTWGYWGRGFRTWQPRDHVSWCAAFASALGVASSLFYLTSSSPFWLLTATYHFYLSYSGR